MTLKWKEYQYATSHAASAPELVQPLCQNSETQIRGAHSSESCVTDLCHRVFRLWAEFRVRENSCTQKLVQFRRWPCRVFFGSACSAESGCHECEHIHDSHICSVTRFRPTPHNHEMIVQEFSGGVHDQNFCGAWKLIHCPGRRRGKSGENRWFWAPGGGSKIGDFCHPPPGGYSN